MSTRYFALISGLVLVVMGLLSFVPGFLGAPDVLPNLRIESGFGELFGLFPVNIVNKLLFLGLGLWGISAYRRFLSARVYSRWLAVIAGIATIFGLIPGLRTLFGIVPMYGNQIWFNAIVALVSGYFGYRAVTESELSSISPYDVSMGQRPVNNLRTGSTVDPLRKDDIDRAG